MRTSLIALLAVSSATLLTACPLAPSCGGFEGEGDVAFQRGTDTAFVCANGGFVGSIAGVMVEGRHDGASVVEGATGARAFDLAVDSQVATSSKLGSFDRVELDEVALDKAHVLCEDLTTRAWWGTAATALPVATLFAKPAEGFDSVGACLEAQAAGDWPAKYGCEDRLVLCPNGALQLVTDENLVVDGTYIAQAGSLGISTEAWGFTGTYKNDGTFASLALRSNDKVLWRTKPIGDLASACR